MFPRRAVAGCLPALLLFLLAPLAAAGPVMPVRTMDALSVTGAPGTGAPSTAAGVPASATGAPASATGAPTTAAPSTGAAGFDTPTRAPVAAPGFAPAFPGGMVAFQSLFPVMWTAGNAYSVTLQGSGFKPGMELRFGSGVTVAKLQLLGAGILRFEAVVAASATSGPRQLEWRSGPTQFWQPATLSATVFAGAKAVSAVPLEKAAAKPASKSPALAVIAAPAAQAALQPGVIELQKPVWQTGGGFGGENKNTLVPLIDDAVLFTWKEENPGLADWFELRLLSMQGNVLASRKLKPLEIVALGQKKTIPAPNWYRPDAKLLDELLDTAQPAGAQMSMAALAAGAGGKSGPAWPQGTQLLWEVVGYKQVPKASAGQKPGTGGLVNYAKQAQAPQEMVDTLVSRSGQWPLAKPARPNGFQACPLDGAGSGLTIYNMTQKDKGVPHPGDEWIVSGSFSLAKSPYAMVAQEIKEVPASSSQMPGGIPAVEAVTEHHFDNVFIDWGDNTGAQPVRVRADLNHSGNLGLNRMEMFRLPDAAEYQQWKNGQIAPDKDSPQYLTHVYAYAGSYKVRVFQLAAGDVQKADPGQLAGAVDGNAGGFVMAGLGSIGARQQGGTTAVIAERAYLVYCHEVKVETWMDTDAQGDLKLKSVQVDGFGADDQLALAALSGPGLQVAADSMLKVQAAAGATSSPAPVPTAPKAESTGAAKAGPGASQVAQADARLNLKAVYAVDEICSGCNKAWTARATLQYTGAGHIDATWWVKLRKGGAALALSDEGVIKVPASPSRTGNPQTWGAPLVGKFELRSPRLPVDPADIYEVWVDARVKPAPLELSLAKVATGAKGIEPVQFALAQQEAAAQGAKYGVLGSMQTGGVAVNYVTGTGGSAVGSSLAGAAGAQQVQGASAGMAAAQSMFQPPLFVKSAVKSYKVIAIDASKLCELKFAGATGDYKLYVDQTKLPQMVGDNVYTGSATLDVPLVVSPSYASSLPVPVAFSDWAVGADGRVAPGSVLKPTKVAEKISPRGFSGMLESVGGSAGQDLAVALTLQPADSLLHYTVDKQAVLPEWKATAPLSTQGDWLASVAPQPDIALGWSGFYLTSPAVRLDLSRKAGNAPAGCYGTGPSWTGLDFGAASIRLNTRDLVSKSVAAPGWGATGYACGKLDVQNDPALQHLTVGKGEISFRRVQLNALATGGFKANYAMDVKVPFINALLHGDNVSLLSTGTDEGSFDFSGLKPDADLERDFGPLHFHIPRQDMLFGPVAAGWRVLTSPQLTAMAEGKPFNTQPVTIPHMAFGLNGRAFFSDEGDPVRLLSISQPAKLGQTSLKLQKLRLDGGTTGSDYLDVNFFGEVKLSDGLPGSPVQVNYAINGSQYAGTGPWNSPFEVAMDFPQAQPAMNNKVAPTYAPDPDAGTRYTGSVDIGMFGGPPVKAEFLLGYNNATDYWLMRAAVPLGSAGITLYTQVTLFAIRGGMGYHVAPNSFAAATPLEDIQPDPSTGLLFSAGVRIGSTDQFIYTVDGDLVATTSGIVRVDFGSWLLNSSPTGQPPFKGWIQYGGGNLDGRMWGHLGYLGDLVYFDLGSSEDNAALAMHLGKGDWYFHAGKKEGPRITAKVLGFTSDSYLMLGSANGLALGGSQYLDLSVGPPDLFSVFVRGYMDMALAITPEPRVSGDFAAGAKAGVCIASDLCESASVTAQVHAEAPPVKVRAHATVAFPLMPDVSFTASLE